MSDVTDVVVTREEILERLEEIKGRELVSMADGERARGERKVWGELLTRSTEQQEEERERRRRLQRTTREDAMRLARLDRRPPDSGRGTSRLAGAQIRVDAPNLRTAVLALLLMRPYGLTDQQMQDVLSLDADTQRARRWELSDQLGLVFDSGRTRETRKGNPATVWVAWKHVEEQAALAI